MSSLDVSDVLAFNERAVAEQKTLPRRMFSVVKLGRAIELSTKTYVDRTRNARNSTKANMNLRGWDVEVILEAGAEYASYLAARGFSHIDEVGRQAAAQIEAEIADMGDRATRG